MPKRPGKERGVEYDRFGRPVVGITSTEVLSEQTAAVVEDDDESEDE